MLGIGQYKFDKEIQTRDGRVDIRVLDMIRAMQGDYDPYYFIECKRLDGVNSHYKNGLNNKCIDNGLSRFVDEKYPAYLEANGMLGFVVKSIDIQENSKYFEGFASFHFIDGCDFSYQSSHITKPQRNIKLYHLMLDFLNILTN